MFEFICKIVRAINCTDLIIKYLSGFMSQRDQDSTPTRHFTDGVRRWYADTAVRRHGDSPTWCQADTAIRRQGSKMQLPLQRCGLVNLLFNLFGATSHVDSKHQ